MAKRKKTSTKKTLNTLEQAHGKLETAVESSKELDQILGMRQKSPYKTANLGEFETMLSGMNLTDMREMAVTAGVFPSGNRSILKKKLLKGFNGFSKGADGSRNPIPVNNAASFPNSDLQEKINDIWARK